CWSRCCRLSGPGVGDDPGYRIGRLSTGVLWRTRTGARWRDLPSGYGVWQTVYGRHRTWSADGTWERLLRELMRGSDADDEVWTVSVDSTSIRAHHHAAGARKSPPLDV